jgi:hypothetical protein
MLISNIICFIGPEASCRSDNNAFNENSFYDPRFAVPASDDLSRISMASDRYDLFLISVPHTPSPGSDLRMNHDNMIPWFKLQRYLGSV